MIKIWGFKIVWPVWSDVWCSDVVSVDVTCRCCVDGVLCWLDFYLYLLGLYLTFISLLFFNFPFFSSPRIFIPSDFWSKDFSFTQNTIKFQRPSPSAR
jgi:hypothetical protein